MCVCLCVPCTRPPLSLSVIAFVCLKGSTGVTERFCENTFVSWRVCAYGYPQLATYKTAPLSAAGPISLRGLMLHKSQCLLPDDECIFTSSVASAFSAEIQS